MNTCSLCDSDAGGEGGGDGTGGSEPKVWPMLIAFLVHGAGCHVKSSYRVPPLPTREMLMYCNPVGVAMRWLMSVEVKPAAGPPTARKVRPNDRNCCTTPSGLISATPFGSSSLAGFTKPGLLRKA
eukprot:303420-Pleurochrysis_carterae.AAC.3